MPAGRPRRHHAAEPARLSGGVSRRAARRPDRGQRQSALHAARIARAARDSRRHRHRDHGEFRAQARSRCWPRRQIRHVVVARLGDFMPALKRVLFNFVNTYVRRSVPAWRFDELHAVARRLRRAPGACYEDAQPAASVAGAAAIYRRHHRRAERRGAHAPQSGRQHPAVPGVIEPYIEEEQGSVLTPLPLYHIFSLTANLLAFAQMGGLSVLVPDPRDIKGLIQHHAPRAGHHHDRRQHAVQRADQHSRTSPRSISAN